ncbi:helix-turn-helix transcriptional regulator [Streptomyces sp. NPDC050738]|uniref:helix-turn-helix domain-containing protein n=1 Tax=Streptomyces sp. NPDC050738 TaxID=3154744 RepID=UPI00342AA123
MNQDKLGNRVSTVLARKLGGELLRLRDAAGLTQPQAAEALTATAAKVAKMERGWVPFRDPDIIALCKRYGVEDDRTVDGLLRLAKLDRDRRKAKGWWQNTPHAGGLAEYIAMEDAASSIRAWQLSLIPGLFQTSAYVRTLAVSDGMWENPDDIERVVEVRLRRQARLAGESPLRVHAVIWEAALRQEIGGPEVMREQLAHLLEVSEQPNVHVQVLPFRAGGHPCVGGAFNILSFADADAIDVVHVDTMASTVWIENAPESTSYSTFFDRTARLSLSPHDSARLIDSISKGM